MTSGGRQPRGVMLSSHVEWKMVKLLGMKQVR